MSNKTYDWLKFIALLILPISVFVASLSNIWGIPYGDLVAQTLSALDVLFGSVVTISKKMWDKEQTKEQDTINEANDINDEGVIEND